jgi:hypothetical protein
MHALICSTFLILASGLLLVTAYRSSGYPMSGAVAPSSVSCTMFSFLHLALASSLSEHTVVELKEVDCMHANPEKRERETAVRTSATSASTDTHRTWSSS